MTIKVSTTLRWPICRQIPSSWTASGFKVAINQPVHACDAWVVYQGLFRPEETIVPPERLYFFGYEPPGLHNYHVGFLNQFSKVITCHPDVQHPGVIHRHQAQPWLAGITRHASENQHVGFGVQFQYEDFVRMAVPAKTRRLSAVCSRKVMVPGHQARLDFVESLRPEVGADCDIFGYGFQPIADKWDALAAYHYHLVLENSCVPDYWTEKVADAFLAWCVPLVWGCPNLADYFPADSFVALDPNDVAGSLAQVRQTISQPPSQKQLSAVAEARRHILEEYNLFPEILRMLAAAPAGVPQKIRLKDERLFLPGNRWRPLVRALTDRWRKPA